MSKLIVKNTCFNLNGLDNYNHLPNWMNAKNWGHIQFEMCVVFKQITGNSIELSIFKLY